MSSFSDLEPAPADACFASTTGSLLGTCDIDQSRLQNSMLFCPTKIRVSTTKLEYDKPKDLRVIIRHTVNSQKIVGKRATSYAYGRQL